LPTPTPTPTSNPQTQRNTLNPGTPTTTTTHLLGSPIKHLALITQRVTPLDQVVNLLPPFQDRLDRLVQDDLGLVEFFLDLHDRVRLGGVLVLGKVLLEGRFELALLSRGEAARGRHRRVTSTGDGGGPRGRELGDESGLFVQDLGDQRESGSVRVFQVGDHHACQARLSGCRGGPEDVRFVRVFFDRRGGVGGGPFGYGLRGVMKGGKERDGLVGRALFNVDIKEDEMEERKRRFSN
jgi:hypothetical protein